MIDSDSVLCMDCIEGMVGIQSESVDLIVADPPYFKVVGEKWDYAWRTEDEYLEWSERWISESSRVLRYGGTFYLFGYFRSLAHILPILEDHGFRLRQQIVLNKGMQAVSGRATKGYLMYPCVTESILFLIKDPIPFSKNLLREHQSKSGAKAKDINEVLGVKTNGGGMWSIYSGDNVCEQLPTEEQWKKLQDFLGFQYPYSKLAQTFNAEMGVTDVWNDIDFYSVTNRIHPTQKPLRLIDRLVRVSSNVGDTVLDPFMGSGTTAIACMCNDRHFIGFESDPEYFSGCMNRIDRFRRQKSVLDFV